MDAAAGARERYALPPRLITHKLVRAVKARRQIQGLRETMLTLLLHFLFGAAAGSLYGLVDDKIPLSENTKGSLMGLAVWSGSYLSWIPALKILPPATEHPWRRNLLMIAAHLVWGVALGTLTGTMNARKLYIDLE